MEPKRIASQLRLIANRIDNSKNPSRHLVAAELRRLIIAMSNLVYAQLETNEATGNSMAAYGYFKQDPTAADWQMATSGQVEGWNFAEQVPWEEREEIPTPLSQAAGLHRYFLGQVG